MRSMEEAILRHFSIQIPYELLLHAFFIIGPTGQDIKSQHRRYCKRLATLHYRTLLCSSSRKHRSLSEHEWSEQALPNFGRRPPQ